MPILMGSRSRIVWRRGWTLCRLNGASLKRSIRLISAQLPFFSETLLPGSLGVNVFAQSPDLYDASIFKNPYVFPPICLIPHVIQYLRSLQLSYTIVIPDVCPRRFWWPLFTSTCSLGATPVSLCRNRWSSPYALQKWVFKPLAIPWDLWVFRIGQE